MSKHKMVALWAPESPQGSKWRSEEEWDHLRTRKALRCWSELREGNGAGEGLEHKCDGAAEGPGGSAGEQELRGDLLISELPERSLEPGGSGSAPQEQAPGAEETASSCARGG